MEDRERTEGRQSENCRKTEEGQREDRAGLLSFRSHNRHMRRLIKVQITGRLTGWCEGGRGREGVRKERGC